MQTPRAFVLGGALLLAAAAPARAQTSPWQDMWFWGAQGGINLYKTATSTATETAFTVGGHWLITGKRSGLYLSYDQVLYDNALGRVNDVTSGTGTRDVQFDNGRLIHADLLAIPIDGNLQLMLGAGVTIHQISDPVVQGTFATPGDQSFSQSVAEDAAIRAFWNLLAGFQLQFGGRFALFGHYQFMPSASGFLVTSEQHTLAGGLRIALSGRIEDITKQ
jgi:hypothetical protein